MNFPEFYEFLDVNFLNSVSILSFPVWSAPHWKSPQKECQQALEDPLHPCLNLACSPSTNFFKYFINSASQLKPMNVVKNTHSKLSSRSLSLMRCYEMSLDLVIFSIAFSMLTIFFSRIFQGTLLISDDLTAFECILVLWLNEWKNTQPLHQNACHWYVLEVLRHWLRLEHSCVAHDILLFIRIKWFRN